MKLTICPRNEDLCVGLIDAAVISEVASVNDGTYRSVQTLPFKCCAFILKAHNSIGIHNEHFLHHRRSCSYHLCCKLPWFARLNMEWKIRLAAAIATAPSETAIPEPADSFVSGVHVLW